MIADLWATPAYRSHLMKLGMLSVTRRGMGWLHVVEAALG